MTAGQLCHIFMRNAGLYYKGYVKITKITENHICGFFEGRHSSQKRGIMKVSITAAFKIINANSQRERWLEVTIEKKNVISIRPLTKKEQMKIMIEAL